MAVRMLAAYGEGSRQTYFCVLGDVERVLLGNDAGDVVAYVPIDQLPARIASGSVLAEGRAGFLAAHAPHSGDALDVMPWRVLQLIGHLHPLLLLYRGPQLLVFLPVGALADGGLRVIRLPRNASEPHTRRVTALVDLPAAPQEAIPAANGVRRLRGIFGRR